MKRIVKEEKGAAVISDSDIKIAFGFPNAIFVKLLAFKSSFETERLFICFFRLSDASTDNHNNRKNNDIE